MKVIQHSLLFTLVFSLAITGAEKAKKTTGTAAKSGIQTPGIQIPFASLKAEAEVPLKGKPTAAIFADQVYLVMPESNQLVKVDPKTNKVAEKNIDLTKPCGSVVRAFGSLWVPNCEKLELTRIDPKNGQVKATISTGASAFTDSITSTADSIWMLADEKTTLLRIDPQQNLVVGEIRLPEKCNSITAGDNSLWVTCPALNKVVRIDPKKNLLDKQIETASQPVSAIFGEGSLWVLCKAEGKVARIDPKTNKVSKTIDLEIKDADGKIAIGEGSVWVTTPGFPISRILPETDKVVQQFKGANGGYIDIGLGSVWLASVESGSVLRIDPRRISATLAE